MEEIASTSHGGFAEYIIETDDARAAAAVLGGGEGLSPEGNMLCVSLNGATARHDIAMTVKNLVNNDINIYSVHLKEGSSLEDVFIELTGKEGDGQIG